MCDEDDQLLSAKDLARLLRTSLPWVYVRKVELGARQENGQWMFNRNQAVQRAAELFDRFPTEEDADEARRAGWAARARQSCERQGIAFVIDDDAFYNMVAAVLEHHDRSNRMDPNIGA